MMDKDRLFTKGMVKENEMCSDKTSSEVKNKQWESVLNSADGCVILCQGMYGNIKLWFLRKKSEVHANLEHHQIGRTSA